MQRALLAALLKGQVHTVGIGIHNFMDALDSCVFKGAVKQDGEWVAVPMCQMNQERWSRV